MGRFVDRSMDSKQLTNKRAERVDTEGKASFVGAEDIGDDTCA